MRLVVLVGASGSGKTTIANAIDQRYGDDVRVFYFDRIGVPSVDRMVAEYGSGEAWQRAKTFERMAKLAPLCGSGHGVLFEGQTRLSFVAEAAEAAGITGYSPILMNWARYLRREARRSGCQILDTSGIALDQCVACVMAQLRGGTQPATIFARSPG
jgi:ABC-type branched-subunit amino acid transport system ATPase component